MRPEIEQLYVQERRKLRYVMQHMERKYGFKATYVRRILPLFPSYPLQIQLENPWTLE